MSYLCSICARRDATGRELIDGKLRPVCGPCVEDEVPDPGFRALRRLHGDMTGSPSEIVLAAVRNNPGVTYRELRDVLNMPGGGCHKSGRTDEARRANTYGQALKRLAASGRVLREGTWPNFTYRIAGEQRRAA